MNPQEAQLSYPFGEALPTPGQTLEVATDVRWVRMGLPFALDHINLWLLRDEVDVATVADPPMLAASPGCCAWAGIGRCIASRRRLKTSGLCWRDASCCFAR